MKTTCARIVMVCGILLVASAIAAQAQKATVYRYSGHGAAAYFSDVNTSGCMTDIFVEFGETSSGSPPKPTQQPTLLYMYIIRSDACDGGSIYAQTDPPALLPEGAVRVSPALKSASLNASGVELIDSNTNSPFFADVNVAWTATGEGATRTNSHSHYGSGYAISNSSDRSVSRNAIANGSVLLDGINFASSPWTGPAWVEQDIRGSIVILKSH